MDPLTQQIAQVIIGIFGGGALVKIIDLVRDWWSGRAGRRRSEVDTAWSRADREASWRRRLQEHVSALRRIITEAPCLSPDVLPPEPVPPESTGPTRVVKESES